MNLATEIAAFGWDERGASLRTSWQSLSFRSRLDRSNRERREVRFVRFVERDANEI